MPKKHDSKMCAECNGFGYTVGAIIHRPSCSFFVKPKKKKTDKPKIPTKTDLFKLNKEEQIEMLTDLKAEGAFETFNEKDRV